MPVPELELGPVLELGLELEPMILPSPLLELFVNVLALQLDDVLQLRLLLWHLFRLPHSHELSLLLLESELFLESQPVSVALEGLLPGKIA